MKKNPSKNVVFGVLVKGQAIIWTGPDSLTWDGDDPMVVDQDVQPTILRAEHTGRS